MIRFALLATLFLGLLGCNPDEPNPIFEDHSLPIVKISIDENYLWSEDSGLFAQGNGPTPNYLQDWEFPSEVQYFVDGKLQFSDKVGFRIKGKRSRHKPNKSLGLYWRAEYGNSKLKYPLFPENEVNEYKRLKLYNGGSHGADLLIRTPIITRLLIGKTTLDFSHTFPVVVYINNQYWGLYNANEMMTPHHFQYLYGDDNDSVNILLSDPFNPVIDDGIKSPWMNEVIFKFVDEDLSDDSQFEAIAEVIDIPSLIDYFVIETYAHNRDWPIFNMKWWSGNLSNKWRYIIYDLDTSFELPYAEELWIGIHFNNSKHTNPELSNGFILLDKLMENQGFQVQFFDRYLYFIDEVFTPERIEQVIDEQVFLIDREYSNHAARWDKQSESDWLQRIDELKSFNAIRREWIRPQIELWLEEAKGE